MKVSAFTYVRNGFKLGYPFVESIRSLLPIVDEYIAVIGDSDDGTREAVAALQNDKIKIIDTVWEMNLRQGGKVFALQANIGMDEASRASDWLFHLQADEVLHEKDLPEIKKALHENLNDQTIDGLLLNFIHFFGDYNHYCTSRRFHQREIRVVRNNPNIRSYKDSMGFRKYINPSTADNEKGEKLVAKQVDAAVYHYSWARPPKKQKLKGIEFHKRYTESDEFIKPFEEKHGEEYQYREYDYLKKFAGTHPEVMKEVIENFDWNFDYDPAKNNMNFKEKFMKAVENITGKQYFVYKNYKVRR